MQHIVGKIDGYDVIYIPEKDCCFCKNTVVPYRTIRAIMKSDLSRGEISDKSLIITKRNSSVSLGCLISTLDNIWEIDKQIKKVRTHE